MPDNVPPRNPQEVEQFLEDLREDQIEAQELKNDDALKCVERADSSSEPPND